MTKAGTVCKVGNQNIGKGSACVARWARWARKEEGRKERKRKEKGRMCHSAAYMKIVIWSQMVVKWYVVRTRVI